MKINILITFQILFFIFLSSCNKDESANINNNDKDTIVTPPYNKEQVLSYGNRCSVLTPISNVYKNDVLHPSVVYIPGGFGGHKWWMAQTPYYLCDNQIENPILYYADEEKDGAAPTKWIPAINHPLVEAPEPKGTGYNSDPNLFYEDGKLWLFWRENWSNNCEKNNMKRAVFGMSSTDGVTWDLSTRKFYMGAKGGDYDPAMCPILKKEKDVYRFYASNFQFKPSRVSLGLAVWEGHSLEKPDFKLKTITKIKCDKRYQPWHFDMVTYDNKYYMILQTNESMGNISIGESTDGCNFTILPKPLIVQNATHLALYKPTAVIKDKIFYLYYTVKDSLDRNHNVLYLTKMPFKDVLVNARDSNFVKTKFKSSIVIKEDY
jgi:hypothetical protein